jgi:hypothetical protein
MRMRRPLIRIHVRERTLAEKDRAPVFLLKYDLRLGPPVLTS